MAKDFELESQSQIERTIMDSQISSIEEISLKPEIAEKVSDSASTGIESCVEMISENSFESEIGGRITVIDDSTVQEKQEILNADSDFIYQKGSGTEICADIKEIQEESVIGVGSLEVERQKTVETVQSISQFENGVQMNPEISFEFEEEGRKIAVQEKQEKIFHVQDVITDDEHLIVVVESQDAVMKISQSQHLVEMSNASKRSENNWDRFLEVKENQVSGEMNGFGNNGGTWNVESKVGDAKSKTSEVKAMPVNFHGNVSKNGNGCGRKENGSMGLGKKRSGSCSENVKQEMARKNENCFKRNGKGMKRFAETRGKQNLLSLLAEARNVCQKIADGSKRRYSRKELEALRFVNCDDQRQIWKEIYSGLVPVVARELNGLVDSKFQNRNGRNCKNTNQQQQQQRTGYKKDNASILGVAATKGRWIQLRIIEV